MLETQLSQLASNPANAPSTQLPGQPLPNPAHHQIKAITLRSGTSYDAQSDPSSSKVVDKNGSSEMKTEEEKADREVVHDQKTTAKEISKEQSPVKAYVPPIPYPQRLSQRILGDKFVRFLELMKGLQVNIPFLEALSQMPQYAKFLKDLLSNKKKLEENVTLPYQVSAFISKNVPKKQRDHNSFTLPVRLGDLEAMGALVDLGATVSLMPLSIAKKLPFEIKPTQKTILLADRSARVPYGEFEDIPIQIGHVIVPCDFVIMDMEVDPLTPLIFGWEALKTLGLTINCKTDTITLEVANEKMQFQFSKMIKKPTMEQVRRIVLIEDDFDVHKGRSVSQDPSLELSIGDLFIKPHDVRAITDVVDVTSVLRPEDDEIEELTHKVRGAELAKEERTTPPPQVTLKPFLLSLGNNFLHLDATFKGTNFKKLFDGLNKHHSVIECSVADLMGVSQLIFEQDYYESSLHER